MKIRNGFVSNSSSSSFTCDVCGTTESGMDAGLSDFDMSQCEHGHTFCNCHQTKTADSLPCDFKRNSLIEREEGRTYKDPVKRAAEVARLKELGEDDVNDEFNDSQDDYEMLSCLCPLCTMDKMDDNDVMRYLLTKIGTTKEEVRIECKEKFNGEYSKFLNYINPPKPNEN